MYKTEVIRLQGPCRNIEDVEFFATLIWADWFNNRRIFEPIGNVPPAEKEFEYYQQLEGLAMAALLKLMSLRQTRGGSVNLILQKKFSAVAELRQAKFVEFS